jgi:DNA modification methylase
MHSIHESLVPLAVQIASLNHDPANARLHDARNLESIKASLSKFGQRKPIVVQRQGMVVRAGNGTLDAAKSLGWTEIAAVIVQEGDVEATAFAIADNRTAELARWDDRVLGTLLSTLSNEPSFDALVTGFNSHEIAKLGKIAQEALPASLDEVPEPPKVPISKLGDLWLLGKHRLMCGDSTDPPSVARLVDVEAPQLLTTDPPSVARLVDVEAPQLLTTDPPYGVSLDMEWRDRAGANALGAAEPSYMRGPDHATTQISGDTRADWSEAFELVPSLKTAYVWHASAFAAEVAIGLQRIGFKIAQQIIWRKPHFALSRQHYHWQHEPCWYARKPGATAWLGTRDQSTIWDAASPKALMQGSKEEKFDHPTQKPVTLYVRPIENHTRVGEVIYEPFGGSGTAVAAAEVTGRRCLAMELDPKFVDVIVDRWERLSGSKAVRA